MGKHTAMIFVEFDSISTENLDLLTEALTIDLKNGLPNWEWWLEEIFDRADLNSQ